MEMDLTIPTTSKVTKPKRRRKTKRLTLSGQRRKAKIVKIKIENETPEDEQNTLEIEKILRKAEFVSSGDETKYLVSWPNTWEPEENLDNCLELLAQFKAGLPQMNVIDDDNTQPFPTEWVVEYILDQRNDENGKPEYLLKWQNTWVNAGQIPANQLQDYEDELKSQKCMTMDVKNNNNNNNDNDVNDVPMIKQEIMKRERSTSEDESTEMEPSAKKQDIKVEKVIEPNIKSQRVIEMELIKMSEKRKVDHMIDIGRSNDGSFSFMLKFKTGELGIMKRQAANIKYPQEVIAFYQRRIQFQN